MRYLTVIAVLCVVALVLLIGSMSAIAYFNIGGV